jgi:hypothetical protein
VSCQVLAQCETGPKPTQTTISANASTKVMGWLSKARNAARPASEKWVN